MKYKTVSEYVVYTARPRGGCRVGVLRIPRGQSLRHVLPRLPKATDRLRTVYAPSATTARKISGLSCGVHG